MDKYEVIGLLGEGSFGRVYKAKQISDSSNVALKVISKRGRSVKEIKGLRRECEIQRHLHHPNIIQMLDSFETDNEIVVITEFAHKELTVILGKEGYLCEKKVQTIVWDLVSALYYLHSHRVLHRDLKPQNILLDSKSNAKLCDFGFARNMSTGTHVLTSIKGTPLYMAPELIEEHPYDHSADLWSLGCITYELLVGAPPFCTTSILHLIRMIRHERIQFPTFISDSCISFLKGLLQKDPTKRLSWPEILKHPFTKGHVLILDDVPSKPLTRLLSMDTLHAKEQQRKTCLAQKTQTKAASGQSTETAGGQTEKSGAVQCDFSKEHGACAFSDNVDGENSNCCEKFASLSVECEDAASCNKLSCELEDEIGTSKDEIKRSLNSDGSAGVKIDGDNLNISEDCSPIENDEWVVFLQRSIEEVIAGEMTSLCQPSLANIVVSPLRNSNASSKVLCYVASLFSLPFVVPGTTDDVLIQIKKVYVDIKLIPNLVYASKLLLKQKTQTTTPSVNLSVEQDAEHRYKSRSDLTEEDLHALERIYLLICHLVYSDTQFLSQFCDSIAVLNMYSILESLLLLSRLKLRIVTDLMAILTQILRKFPENHELITRVVLQAKTEAQANEVHEINFVQLLRHSSSLLRERSCYFLQFLGRSSPRTLEAIWSDVMRDTFEALVYDSMENVRNAAEMAVQELQVLPFYYKVNSSNESGTKETRSE